MLQSIADGAVVDLATVRDRMAALLALTAKEMADPLPSGRGTRFQNRVAWAKAYL
jgi:restriction endonuclease Mrr